MSAQIISFTPRQPRPKPQAGPGEILFFLGVRYERYEAEEARPLRVEPEDARRNGTH
ncbi:MAG: hypothetical protein INR68_04415 [Methylobacterium mesophilicum]|nr:hypothetical protein [Methylobacterium mesophilicum]